MNFKRNSRRLVVGTVGNAGFQHVMKTFRLKKKKSEIDNQMYCFGWNNKCPYCNGFWCHIWDVFLFCFNHTTTWNQLKRVSLTSKQSSSAVLTQQHHWLVSGSPPSCGKFQGQGAFSWTTHLLQKSKGCVCVFCFLHEQFATFWYRMAFYLAVSGLQDDAIN